MSEQTTQRKAEAPPRVVLPREISLDAIKAMSSDELRGIIRKWAAAPVNSRIFGRS